MKHITSKLLSLLLTLAMLMSMVPAAYADEIEGEMNGEEASTVTTGVAKIDGTEYESLDAAITAVSDGQIIVVNAGEYKLNGALTYTGKAFTIQAAEGAKVSFDMSAAVALHGAKITFNGVTFDYKTNGNYIGLQHTDTLVYNNCTIIGKVFLYATNETFNNCTFKQEAKDYNVWTYGARNVAFNGCTFNCVGKSVLLYNEGANDGTNLTVSNTEFIASAPVEGKAAIEIDTHLMSGGSTVTVDGTTTATGFATGSNSNSPLWNDKTQTADTNKNTTVTVAGETVFAPAAQPTAVARTANGSEYTTLAEALAAVNKDNALTYVDESVWPESTPVYYNGGFYGTIGEVLYDAQQQKGAIQPGVESAVIYCRPGATISKGNASHPSFVTSTTIYGNGATLTGATEWDVENYFTLTKDITINIYSLNGGASVWSTRKSDFTVTVNMENCQDAHEVLFNYGSGNGRVIANVKNCTFLKSGGAAHGWPVSINCLGSLTVDNCTFDGVITGVVVNVKQPSENGEMKVSVTNSTFHNVMGQDANKGALRVTGQKECKIDLTIGNVQFTGTHAVPEDITLGNAKSEDNLGEITYTISNTTGSLTTHKVGDTTTPTSSTLNGTTVMGTNAATAVGDGTKEHPYTLEQLGAMTRAEYIAAQTRLGGTMYVTVGDYSYDTNGTLGNGERNDTPGQTPDHSKLNAYGENGYLDDKNDGANGKKIVFVNGSITSGVTGYTSIDKIGTSLLLAVPAYTNVTFEGITFNNVMSFDYQLYTSPWSQLGELKFDGCTFNGIIVGAIAAQTLTFNGCEFKNYTNKKSANSSNPTWIRPAYGNWTKDDNKGQGDDFRSLTTINFTNNNVTSTRPVKFEYISQWDIRSKVTATGNYFDISAQATDNPTEIKNVGLYLGAHTDANAFDLVVDNNTKSDNTFALYTIPEGKTSLPVGSTVKDPTGKDIELTDALKWKATDPESGKITLKTVTAAPSGVAAIGSTGYATLAKAIAAAKDGETVKLLANVVEDVVISKSITLDLGGKTLTNTNAGAATLTVAAGATATVKNGSIVGGTGYYNIQNNGTATFEDVTATAGNDGLSMIDNYGDLTINSGSYTGGLDTIKNEADAKLTITGGTFTLEKGTSKGFTGVVFNYGKLNISGGTFIQIDTSAPYGQAQVIHTDKSGSNAPSTIITGGSFTNKCTISTAWPVRETNAAAGSTEVKGGRFNKEVTASYLADGYTQVKNADGMYSTDQYVAKIGTTGYKTLAEAITAANESDSAKTITLLQNVKVADQIVINNTSSKTITLDLNKLTLTSTYTLATTSSAARYALVNNTPLTVKNGTFAAGEARAIGGYAKLTLNGATVTQTLTGGHACVAFCADGATYTVNNKSVIKGAYSLCIFANNATVTVSNSTLEGTGNTLYHNGSNYGLKLTVKNTKITSSGSCGVYISGSTSAQENAANQNGAGGYQKASFTGCTISGAENGIEVKYTDLTLNGCTVKSTSSAAPSYLQDNNGPAASGFAVVSTDNAMNGATPKPEGTITITGDGNYTGLVGLGALESVKTQYAGFKDETIKVSGGTFSSKVLPEYCATGFVPTENVDGTFGVKVDEGIADEKALRKAFYEAATDGTVTKIKLTGDITLEMLYAAENFGSEKLDDNAAGDTFNRYKLGVHPTAEDPNHWNPLVINQTQEQRVAYGAYYHMNATDERIARLVVKAGQNIELDLNGHTIQKNARATHGDWSNVCTDIIGNYGTLTITDTSTGEAKGTIMGRGYTTCTGAVLHNYAGATMTVGAVNVDGNAAGMTAGTGQYVIRNEGGSVTINGTNVFDTATSASLLCNDSGTMKVTGNATLNHPATKTVNVKGGTVEIESAAITSDEYAIYAAGGTAEINGAVTVTGNGTLAIDADKGGAITKTVGVDMGTPDGYKWVDGENGRQTLTKITYVAEVNGKKYDTLQEAIDAANGQTVILLADTDITSNGLTIAKDKSITLDLSGHSLKAANTNAGNIMVCGTLTLTDSTDTAKNGTGRGKVYTETPYIRDLQDKVLIAAIDGGTFIMESGLIDAASFTTDNTNQGQFAVSVQNENDDATVIINGGHIKAGWYAVAGNGNNVNYKGNITVNGGILESTADYAIYHPHAGTTTINGGTVYGAAGGVSLNRGKLVVNGGTITSKGTGATGDWGDGTGNQKAAAINVNAKYETTSVEIKGGTITAENDAIVLTSGRDGTIAVSGGTFSSEVKPEYCAIGFVPKANSDGTYGVKAAEGNAYYTNGDGKVVYGDLSALLTDSETEGKTITLLTNVTSAKSIALWDDRTIDLAGLVLEFTGNAKFMTMDGWIKDSTNGNGLLKIAQTYGEGKQTTAIQSSNEQLPIYDSAKGGYRLFDCKMVSMKQAKGDGVVIWLCPQFKNLEAYKLLKSGNAHNTAVSVIVSWNTTSGEKVSRSFEFTQAMMDTVVNNYNFETNRPGQLFKLTLTGLGSDLTGVITNVAAQPCMGSKTGALKVGEMISLAN